jgi:hypothetical protein
VIWAAAVVALGMQDGSAKAKAIRLGLFGLALGFAFMCLGYEGDDTIATRVVPFAVIGAYCGGCAIALGGVVHLVLTGVRRIWQR